ncbi:MAG TPA: DNA translocase FtsK 4TM domain-containing protein [Opitutaceae bacterium]|nr:DNA translocase FtsK 4TM domain-containing protein [Opitutaceae bacterium]
MAKTASSNSNPKSSLPGIKRRPNWPVAVILFLLGILLTVAFLDYAPEQSYQVTTNPTDKNLVGLFGAETTYWTLHWLGASTWLVPIFLLWLGYILLRNARRLVITRLVAMLLCIGSFSGLWAMWETFGVSQYFTKGTGGGLGQLVYEDAFKETLGVFGSALLMGCLYALSLLFIFTKDITSELEKIVAAFHAWRERKRALQEEQAVLKREFAETQARQRAVEQTAQDQKQAAAASATAAASALTAKKQAQARTREEVAATKSKASIQAAAARMMKEGLADGIVPDHAAEPPQEPESVEDEDEESETKSSDPLPTKASAKPSESRPSRASAPASSTRDLEAQAGGRFELNIVKPEEPKKTKAVVPSPSDSNYQFPTLSLLKEQSPVSPENSEEEHRRNAENLLRILSEFGVQVTLGEIHVGPVITRYEIVPAPGVRVEKIAGLDKNIALGMRAQSVRILAPIPGKAAVGVEVPNQYPIPVGMREILESEIGVPPWPKEKFPWPWAKTFPANPLFPT